MLELTRSPNNYTLTYEDGTYILCVSLDASGFNEVNYKLNAGEIYSYESQKEPFLNLLAQQIRDNPDGFGKVVK
ncbi:hypothetical protein [Flavobacterium silvaticum]|uniref:Uncharacterized protein n=1 Tax=Flavobacterium silvaticum TaxID=1852020 RepID=A0A972JGR2_9FLAO|nr:hypothetical protein [Flavobacterium silvaticum]NMH28466.1 hypothetical protein [Flavobacterium silvaticum]